MKSSTFVDIEVVDDNDVGPRFEPTEYSLAVNEDVPLGEVLHFFTVTDGDIGLNTRVNFFISEGNQGHAFTVINKISPIGGEIITENRLDYETTKEYTLTVMATDGRSISQPATVSIKVRRFPGNYCVQVMRKILVVVNFQQVRSFGILFALSFFYHIDDSFPRRKFLSG